MNTMLRKRLSNSNPQSNIFVQFNNFAENIRRSGKDPKVILDELIRSGKVTQEQVDKATALAKSFGQMNNLL